MADPRLAAIFAQLRWHARPERFVVAGLAPRERLLAMQLLRSATGPFVQFTVEPDMLTLIVAEADWRILSPAFPRARVERPLRVISFDVDLPADLKGFLAAITGALATAGVPLLAICGYTKDHVLVREEHLDAAMQAVAALVSAHRQP
jgi:uncharacterized protein